MDEVYTALLFFYRKKEERKKEKKEERKKKKEKRKKKENINWCFKSNGHFFRQNKTKKQNKSTFLK